MVIYRYGDRHGQRCTWLRVPAAWTARCNWIQPCTLSETWRAPSDHMVWPLHFKHLFGELFSFEAVKTAKTISLEVRPRPYLYLLSSPKTFPFLPTPSRLLRFLKFHLRFRLFASQEVSLSALTQHPRWHLWPHSSIIQPNSHHSSPLKVSNLDSLDTNCCCLGSTDNQSIPHRRDTCPHHSRVSAASL